jgi:aminoglycoside phosphotransferase (APT) family kinase protein
MNVDADTIEVRSGETFDVASVERYVRTHIPGLPQKPLQVRQFPFGASNLTYLLRIGSWEGVLRRPPFGPVAPKAHDIEREARLLQHIHPVFPLAPRPYCFCDDLSILQAPFYIMERRHGIVINDRFPAGIQPNTALCQQLSNAVVETLVQIHSIDWQAAGLGAFGHPQGFLSRQVRGWIERYFRAQTDDLPRIEPLTRWLTDHVPASPHATLIHNDFKLNNMLLQPDNLSQPVAVLDWEMATIGDPLFDLAVSLTYWVNSDDPAELQTVLPAVTSLPGFITRAEFMQRYAQKSGRDLSSMHFYLTFAYFKLAVIIQQIYVRWKRGQTHDERFAAFGKRAYYLLDYAANLAEQGL